MTLRGLVASGLIAAGAVAPALAEGTKSPVRVSTEVVRSCRVTTDQPQVSVTCSSRSQSMQVSLAGATPVARTAAAQPAASPAAVQSVTIHF